MSHGLVQVLRQEEQILVVSIYQSTPEYLDRTANCIDLDQMVHLAMFIWLFEGGACKQVNSTELDLKGAK